MIVDQAMRERIEAAIAKAEQGTHAEFVAAVSRRADEYRSNVLAAACLAALTAGLVVWVFAPWPGPGETLIAELLAFLIVYAFGVWTNFGMVFVPASRKRRMVGRLARLVFLERGLAATEEHCGVLFFVSEAECFVEIIADRGIDQAVEPGAWQKIVDGFTAAVKRGEVEQGFVGAIESLGVLLARHYPPVDLNVDRIPNRLLELP